MLDSSPVSVSSLFLCYLQKKKISKVTDELLCCMCSVIVLCFEFDLN